MSGLHVGLTPWRDDWDGEAESLAAQAQRAESLGFRSFWLPESHFSGSASNPAPLLRLAAVASRTKTLRLGTTSFLLPLRHPLHVAEEVAVLDRLSNGRVILGVGRGFRRATFTAFDVPVAEKRDLFEAAMRAILAAWDGQPVAWEGGEGDGPVRLAPLPVQKPHPPIWVAAFGPKALAQAGRLGFPYLASPIEPLSRLYENYARHREVLDEAGHAGDIAVPVMRTAFVSRNPTTLARAHAALSKQAAALARAPSQSLRRAASAEPEEWAFLGEPEAVADGIAALLEKLGMTHLVVRGGIPGVEPAAVDESLTLLAELGLDRG